MILSDREIQIALDRGMLRITPAVTAERFSSTAIDLTLDAPLQRWEKGQNHRGQLLLDPTDKEFNVTRLAQDHAKTVTCERGAEIRPGSLILGWTIEKVQLPRESRLAARVEGKSSLARIGIGVHITAPTIHAGFGFRAGEPSFEGNSIQLEVWNFGPFEVRLTKRMPICQRMHPAPPYPDLATPPTSRARPGSLIPVGPETSLPANSFHLRAPELKNQSRVEEWRGGLGLAYLLPALSSAGASLA